MTKGKSAVPPTERDLFLEVMARPAATREKYLRERAGAWPKLVDQVLGLLAHTSTTECLVAAADAAVDGAAPRAPQAGSDETATGTVTGSQSTWQAFLEQLREVGCNFARYRHVGDVGHGGQGVILRVEDIVSRRPLAMKRIKSQETAQPGDETPGVDDATLGRFLDEAQIQAQLDHPSIVPVHEIGIDDRGRVYFTMKFVKGESLGKVFDKVRAGDEEWTVERALHSMVRVCEAMAYAHSKGVVHRDLKPGNVMVGRFGEVFVMDWGLARVLGEPDRRDIRVQPAVSQSRVEGQRSRQAAETPDQALVTMDGAVLGTPFYMPPEQAAGRIEDVGTGADVYSAGAMLYHLLAGRAPYERPGARVSPRTVLELVMQGAPESLTRLTKPPAALVAIVEKAMAREVKDRYPSMVELAKDLRAYLDGRVVQAFGTGVWQEVRSFVRRNRAVAMVAAGALVVTGGLVWAVVDRESKRAEAARGEVIAEAKRREDQEEWGKDLQKALENERQLRAKEEAARMEAQGLTYRMAMEAALNLARKAQFADASRELELAPVGLRGFEWEHVRLLATQPTRRSFPRCGPFSVMAMSADRSLLVYAAGDSIDIAHHGTIDELPTTLRYLRSVAISGDGRVVVCSNGRELQCWDRMKRVVKSSWHHHPKGHVARITNSPNLAIDQVGRRLVYSTDPMIIRIRDLDTGAEKEWRDEHADSVPAVGIPLAMSPAGDRAAFSDHGVVCLWSTTGSDGPDRIEVGSYISSVDFSPDGRRLAVGVHNGLVYIYDCYKKQRVAILKNDERPGESHHVAFTLDGEAVISVGSTQVQILDCKNGGARSFPFAGHVTAVFSGSDSVLLQSGPSVGELLTRYRPAISSIYTQLQVGESVFSPSGTEIAAACGPLYSGSMASSRVFVMASLDGRPIRSFPGNRIAYTSDGRTLAVGSGVATSCLLAVDSPALPCKDITLHDISGVVPDRVLAAVPWGVNAMAFSPDGQLLAACTGSVLTDDLMEVFGRDTMRNKANRGRKGHHLIDGEVCLWSVATGVEVARTKLSGEMSLALQFHPKGEALYVGGADGRVRELSTRLEVRREFADATDDPVTCLAVDPEREFLAIGRESGRVQRIRLADGVFEDVADEKTLIESLTWSSDGRRLAISTAKTLTLRARDCRQTFKTEVGGSSVSFSPDGTRLLVGDQVLETSGESVLSMARGAAIARGAASAVKRWSKSLKAWSGLRKLLLEDGSLPTDVRDAALIFGEGLALDRTTAYRELEILMKGLSPVQHQQALALLDQIEAPYFEVARLRAQVALKMGELSMADREIDALRRHLTFIQRYAEDARDGEKVLGFIAMLADLMEAQVAQAHGDSSRAKDLFEKAKKLRDSLLASMPDDGREEFSARLKPLFDDAAEALRK